MSMTLEQFGADQLSVDDRLKLIELLWDSIPADIPVAPPAWHIDELKRRMAAAEANPNDFEAWEDLYARLSRKS